MPHECCNTHRWHWYQRTKNIILHPIDIYVLHVCSFKITLEIIKIKSPTYLDFFAFIFLRRHWPRRTPRSTGIRRYVRKIQSNNVCSFRGIVFDTQLPSSISIDGKWCKEILNIQRKGCSVVFCWEEINLKPKLARKCWACSPCNACWSSFDSIIV